MKTSCLGGYLCALAVGGAMLVGGCVVRPVEKAGTGDTGFVCKVQPLFLDKDVDILFVVDDSGSMGEEQQKLRAQFPRLIEALKSKKLGGKLPNVRIGVVSTDLGAGNLYVDNACVTDGDKGKLHNKAQIAGCTLPKDAWIEYRDTDGVITTNIPGAGDSVKKVKDAFSCIGTLGTAGCGFEQTILSAQKALDPTLNINAGFLRNGDPCKANREDALLAVVFITDEDDCSAANPQLFDPSQGGLNDPLGPLTSFRCFEFGVKCDCVGKAKCDRFTTGQRKNCVPGGQYLHKMENFVSFFKNLKKRPDRDATSGKCTGKANPDRVIMAAIAGPTGNVSVEMVGGMPSLKPSCSSSGTLAAPAVRIKALVHAFAEELTVQEVADIKAKQQNTPYYVDSAGKWRAENFTSICNSDFSPALERLGARIIDRLGTLCLSPPALTDNGGIICKEGDIICDAKTCGKVVKCEQGCLTKANFTIQQYTSAGRITVPKCSEQLFDPKLPATSCGGQCPCWRVVPSAVCASQKGASPYSVEIMNKGTVPKGTYASVCTMNTTHAWGSKEFGELKQCN